MHTVGIIQLMLQQFLQQFADVAGHDAAATGADQQFLEGAGDIDAVTAGIVAGGGGMTFLVCNQVWYFIGDIYGRVEGEGGDGRAAGVVLDYDGTSSRR